ncbi:putative Peptidase M3A/M3B catalytic domain-containing protein [Seiridium unicorne]|uniref:Peptidase M3A/M3B catalytic domain-containing protein n=1 Tax=Seiridium unicorne TaxID=138068 RepID=A0ABR2UUX5_9PEZI
MAPDKYKNPPQAPPTFTGTKESIVSDAKALCDSTRSLLDKLAADVPVDQASFKKVLKPVAKDEDESGLSGRILGFYQYVSGDAQLRDASSEAEKIMDEFGIECNMREDIFQLVDSIAKRQKENEPDLDAESLRLLDKERKNYIKNGLGLPKGPQRDRFKEIKTRLSQISIQFQKNLNEEDDGLWFTKEELDGVPDDVVDGLNKGKDENDGKIRLTFKYPDLFPALKFAKNPETRKKIFIANENKINDNVPLFREAILLRDEAARMLGYPNHAALRIEDKMAKEPATVNTFLSDLRKRLAAGGVKEKQHLLELKNKDEESRGLKPDGKYYLWDHRFYDRMMVEKEYNIDETKIAEYFPLSSTIRSMLQIFEEIFGLAFVELDEKERARLSPTSKAEDIAWHEDVVIFSVWDDSTEGDAFVGYLYLDLHPRPGKYGHAANFNLQPGYLKPDGSRRYPATALVCNFSKPTEKKPSLLKHDEVVTLFHELGHGIHDLAGRCKYSRFHGTSTVRDFVEAPSQMLENWCWTPSQIKALSKHYETGEPIPDDLIEKQISTKHVNDALFNLRQLHFGIYDMTVHSPNTHEELEKLDLSKLYNDLRSEIAGLDGPEALGESSTWGHGQATFGHLIGGYDAGYYGYLSSLVYSTDMFYSHFKKNPMDKKEGRRYRHTVLERGGSQDEMVTLEQFLGRQPSSEAFYRELGVDLTRRSIRLIRLLPAENDDDPICCELYTAQLTPELQFAALSYVWGTSSETYNVFANGIEVKVTRNLRHALWHFRNYDMLRSEDNRLPLWVDALCINQNDTQERNHQVAHMGDIYRHAKPVLSWLGYGISSIRVAFDAIRDIASSIRPLQQPGDIEGGEIDMERGIEWLVNHRDFWQTPQNSTDEVAPWLAIQMLSRHRYWKRTWIVQELVLANINTHYFVHGKETLSCRNFSTFYEFRDQLAGRNPPAPPIRSLSFTENQWKAFSQKVYARFHTWRLVKDLKQGSASTDQSMIFNLALFTSATEPRDMIFGLAGFMNTINPDYNKGVGEIYLDWAQGLIQSKIPRPIRSAYMASSAVLPNI